MPHTLRLAAFLAGLLTFLSWEVIAPHHAATASKPRRWLVNLGLALLNGLIVTSLCAACYVIALRRMAPWRVGLFELTAAPSWLRLPAEIAALDLLTYCLHRSYHRVPLMWRFHRVHHTDLDLDVSSASRFHLGEVTASSVAKLAFVALLGISYQGLVGFEIVLLLAAQFQHANIDVHPRLEPMLWWTFVPPAMHRVHHSPEQDETDSNFGTLLVAWDRLFATLRTHTASSPPFGLWDWRDERRLGFGKVLALPFFRGCAAAADARAGTGERLEPGAGEAARRTELVRRGQGLTYATLALNSLEAIVAIAAGLAAGSVALLGFGVDSLIELTAGVTALWRLFADFDLARRARVERTSLRIVGACFLALAVYVAYEAGRSLVLRERPAQSLPGIVLAVLSLVSMPLLARAKRRVALGMSSGALAADARQTALCGYLSAILLGGLLLNGALGWWWADPLAALCMLPIITKEGLEAVQGRSSCDCC